MLFRSPRASPEDGSSTAHRLLGGPELVGRHVAWGPALGRVEMPCAPAEASLQTSAVLSALGAAPLPSLPTELPVLPSAQVSMEFPRPALPLHPIRGGPGVSGASGCAHTCGANRLLCIGTTTHLWQALSRVQSEEYSVYWSLRHVLGIRCEVGEDGLPRRLAGV